MYAPGQIINGRYRIVRKLGKGAFSSVYLAVDTRLQSQVVLKIFAAASDPNAVAAFDREGQALNHVRHPNIVQIYDSGLTDGRPFLVLEYIDGETLQTVLRRGPVPLRVALNIAEAIAEALAAAHNSGIIHRDIKPSNVLIPIKSDRLRYQEAKLTDFGITGRLSQLEGKTMSGELFGTPYYMAPEQILAEPQSPATDVYGLGVLLYEMLYGSPPFMGRNLAEVFKGITNEGVSFPTNVHLPDEVISFLRRSLDKDPKKRLQTANEAEREIRRLLKFYESQFEEQLASISPPSVETSRDPALEATLNPGNRVPGMYDTLPGSYRKPPTNPDYASQRTYEQTSNQTYASPSMPTASRAKAGASRFIAPAVLILIFLAVLLVRALGISWRILGITAGIIFGMLLIVGGILFSLALRRWLKERRSQIAGDASEIVFGSQSRETLTASLAIQVDQVVSRVRSIDEKILANTLAIMVKEYEAAKECQDRMLALMNAVQLMEKLKTRFSPWYVQHERMLTLVVALIGVASGVASIAASLVQISAMRR